MGFPCASTLFVQDAIIFFATIVPLIYFFDINAVLLLNTVHVISIPCAAAAHVLVLGPIHTFFLTLITGSTLVVDFVSFAFSACQLVQTNLCCDALRVLGFGCFKNFEDIPLAVILLPISGYNAIQTLFRLSVIWNRATPSGVRGIATAILATILGFYVALFNGESRLNRFEKEVMFIVMGYAILNVLMAASNIEVTTSMAFISNLFITHVLVISQAYLALCGRSSWSFVVLASVILAVSSACAMPFASVKDRWTPVYSLLVGGVAVFVVAMSWTRLTIVMGTLQIAYFTTLVGRNFAFRVDSQGVALFAAQCCAVTDTLVIIYATLYRKDVHMWLWVVSIASVSDVVSLYTFLARVYDLRQVEHEIESNITKNINFEEEKVDIRTFKQTEVVAANTASKAYHAGAVAGAAIILDMDPVFETGLITYERIDSLLLKRDTVGYLNPESLWSTRLRVLFLRGVMNSIGTKIDSNVAFAAERTQRHRLGITKRVYDEARVVGGSWGLDVGWIPRPNNMKSTEVDMGVRRLMAIRVKAICERYTDRDKTCVETYVRDEVMRRYRFAAARESFKLADTMQRYEMYWNIVWS
jgi:hypothetical protein